MTQNTSDKPHFEIEVKVHLGRDEHRRLQDQLPLMGYAFTRRTLIVDFVEPARRVTSRVRLEKPIDGDGKPSVACYKARKSHPIGGKLEDFVRHEQDPAIPPQEAVDLLVAAIEAQNGEPIPYYAKKRRYYEGNLAGFKASISLDKPKGLKKKWTKRFLEVEIQLPLTCSKEEVASVVKAIERFIFQLLGEKREPQISYRRMLMHSW